MVSPVSGFAVLDHLYPGINWCISRTNPVPSWLRNNGTINVVYLPLISSILYLCTELSVEELKSDPKFSYSHLCKVGTDV